MAKELTEAGLQVLALERGPARDTYPDGVYPQTMDELTYNSRKKLFMDISRETVTLRHSVNDVARLPAGGAEEHRVGATVREGRP
ncbi:hypothetical protein WR25_08016 [Diploscapter pachys]|uniref:Uncharacterized protein n=1 Tax=Diploscapter pachys TaxID=2018661 RepID=A0A2A2K8A5_9BILA|nr:hypothetical protein WR25_08016 [Diploscapter pachys]